MRRRGFRGRRSSGARGTLRTRSGAGGVGRRRGFAFGARNGAEDGSLAREEGSAEEAGAARVAGEAALGGVPVLALVRHLALVDADGLAARVAVLGEAGVEAGQAVGARLAHDVALPAQLPRALGAREVLHVPRATFRLCALVGQDYLLRQKKNH